MEYDRNSEIERLMRERELYLHTYVQARCRSAPLGEQIQYYAEWYEAYTRLEKALNKND